MDLAKTVVRSCVRSFHSTREILIVDALAVHSALRDDDLAYLMSMNTKDLRKICASLVDARFISMHTRSELKEGQTRPVSRTYYFIDYRQAIDGMKWRVFKLQQDNQAPAVPADERKEYICPRCKSEYTLMEVLDSASPAGFRCHKCDAVLTQNVDGQSEGQQRVTRLNEQLDFLVSLLNEVDDHKIPDNSFDKALANAVAVERDAMHQIVNSVPVESDRPTAVRGLAVAGPDHLDINIHQGEGKSAEEIEIENRRQEKLAKQNEMPEWMLQSTVDGAIHRTNTAMPNIARQEQKALAKQESLNAEQDAEMKRMFEEIKEQNQADAQRKKEEQEASGSDEEDDEEDDFEDVVADVPAVKIEAAEVSVKRESSVQSPDRPVKKVKVEEPPADEMDDEELDFEDV